MLRRNHDSIIIVVRIYCEIIIQVNITRRYGIIIIMIIQWMNNLYHGFKGNGRRRRRRRKKIFQVLDMLMSLCHALFLYSSILKINWCCHDGIECGIEMKEWKGKKEDEGAKKLSKTWKALTY